MRAHLIEHHGYYESEAHDLFFLVTINYVVHEIECGVLLARWTYN